MSNRRADDVIRCSFCGRTAHEVTSTVAGPHVHICDSGLTEAAGIVRSDLATYQQPSVPTSRRPPAKGQRLTPHEIKKALDEYVIGQDRAKKSLAVAVYNHYKRIDSDRYLHEYEDVELEKSNILLIGPTGVGKTLLARTLARILDVPFSISAATELPEAGYVGEEARCILPPLLPPADFTV